MSKQPPSDCFQKKTKTTTKQEAKSHQHIHDTRVLKEPLMGELSKWIDENHLKQADAAEILKITRPRVSDVVNKNISKFTIDALVDHHKRAAFRVMNRQDQLVIKYKNVASAGTANVYKELISPNGGTMKGLSAKRIQISIGDIWKSPDLHVLLTQEEKVVVARCLDFTVSSHGETEKEAIQALGESIKEYLLTAIEQNAMDAIYDPAQNKYWRMFNEIEAKSAFESLKRSITNSLNSKFAAT
jgi:predicted XRE-type DNA-binding protein/predicted RNase H-like HicB family nuclease